ncbi:MAG: autotransporter-associated beta strand repeat-containing protein [Luteolibacter sp.]
MKKPWSTTLPVLAIALGTAQSAWAANKTWGSTPTTANLNLAGNWGGTLPAAGDLWFFGTSSQTTLNNDFAAAFSVQSITFNSGANAFTIGGNSITLGGNIVNNSTSSEIINFGIATTAVRTFQTNGGGGNLSIGAVSGSGGGITKTGLGTLTLTAINSYTGNTQIDRGSIIFGSSSLASVSQTLGNLVLSNNNSTAVTSVFGSSGNASLTFGAPTFNTSGTVNFVVSGGTNGSTNQIKLTAAAGFLNKLAYFNGADYAYVDTTNGFLRAAVYGTDAGFSNAGGSLATSAHNQISSSITGQGSDSVNTLKFTGAGAVNLAQTSGTTLTLNTNSGILRSGGGSTTISGGTITQGNGLTYVLRADSASDSLTINSNIGANGVNALVTGGAGTITFGGTNAYTGTTTVNEGTTTVTGTLATNGVVVNGGTLNLNNTNALTGSATIAVGQGVAGNGAGTISITQANNNTGAITLNAGGTLVVGASGALGTGTLTVNGGLIQANGTANINNVFNNGALGNTIGGSGNLTFGGQLNNNINGTQVFIVNNTGLTKFSGGLVESNAATARVFTISGTGDVIIDSAIKTFNGATGAQGLAYQGTGTLTLSNANGGNTTVDGGGGGSNAISIATGTAPVTGVAGTSGTTGNSTLKISGNYTIGTAGINTLTIAGGNATTTTRGTLSLVDGTAGNTLTINSSAAAANVLTIAGGTGAASNLNMEIGSNTTDTITLGSGQKTVVGAGGVFLNVAGLGSLTGGGKSFTLLSAPGGGMTAAGTNFTLATSGNFGGYTTANLTSTTTTALILTLGGYVSAPNTAYWKDVNNASWGTLTGGTNSVANWTDSAGSVNTQQTVGSNSDVFFSATGAVNTATTLDTNYSIKSLTFNSSASISNNTLTVGNTTTGITVASGQTGTINSALGGTSGVVKNGTGALMLGGNNTYTGGLTINDGLVTVANAGALNSTTPQTVTFGMSAPSTAKLQLNGNSISIGALSTNATPGTPVIENGHASTNATLTVSQTSNTTYAGTIQNGSTGTLGLVKSGSGTLTLSGNNTYTGTTAVNSGTLNVTGTTSGNGNYSVASGAILSGTGTVSGATTILSGGYLGAGTIGDISGGALGTSNGAVGTLTFTSGLSLNSGSVVNFDNGDYLNVGGIFTAGTGTFLRFDSSLAGGSYNLIGFTGTAPTLANFTLQYQNGNPVTSSYSIGYSSGNLVLTVVSATTPTPSLTISSPLTGSRLMQNTTFSIGGTISNVGAGTLNATLADNGGTITATSISPTNPSVAAGASTAYTASGNTGSTLGANTLSIIATDPLANPTSSTVTNNISVLQDRVVSASMVSDFGSKHVGASVTGSTSLTSTGADDSNTRVTVANAGADANGISVTGGSGPTFNGTTSDTRTVSGNLSTLGLITGAITLTTTGEAGVSGQIPVNVAVNYSALVYSGKAAWNGDDGSWVTGGNWADTQGGGVAGSPGVDGALSIGDTATFGDAVAGSHPSNIAVSLNGTSPTLAGMTFNSALSTYTLATGSGGTITLQSAATPIAVSTTLSPTISAVLTGAGLSKTGTGTLILGGANTYTGATAIINGAIQTIATNALPVATTLTLGSGTNSGKLILGDANGARSQTLAGLVISGTGSTNSLVGGSAVISTLTLNIASTNSFAGILGGAGTNENNLALTKTGGGTLTLTGNNTYAGGSTLSAGTLNLGSANAVGTTGSITFAGGTLQYSASNTTDYSSRLTTTGNSAYLIDTNGQNVTFSTGLAASGSSGLTKTGTGSLTLTTGNTYSGLTTINAGVLVTADLLTNSVNLNGGVWQPTLTGNTTFNGTLGSTGAGALNAWLQGGFAAKGGKLTVTINSGADLSYQVGGFLGSGTTPMIFGSSAADNQVEVTNNINLNTGDAFQRILIVNPGLGGDSALLSGVLSGGAGVGAATGFKKQGDGILILSGNNTLTGLSIINAGTLVAGRDSLSGSSGAFGTGTGPSNAPTAPSAIQLDATTGASPSLMIGGAFTVGRAVTINNTATTGTYSIGGSTASSATFSGLVTTSQNLKVTQVAGGTLNITGGMTGGANTPTVTFDNIGDVVVSTTAISNGGGTLALNKTNSGILTLSAVNTYTGTTLVSGGKLIVNGSISTGAVTVGNSATLGGSGTIGGATTIQSGGVHAPGNSPGVETFTSNLNYADGSIFAWDIDRTQSGRGAAYDAVNVTGALAGSDGADAGSTFDAVFRIVIGDSDFSNAFWSANDHSWTDIFTSADGTTAKTDWASIFGGGFQYYHSGGSVLSSAPTTGSFSLSGNTLSWTYSAVPEVSNALAGVLLATGLLRRKRRTA